MKKKLIILLVMCSIVSFSYAQYHSTVQSATKSSVTMRVIGYGKNAKIASVDAENNAIKTLLFAGAQDTSYRLPFIPDNKETVETKNKDFFGNLYKNEYKNFIESSIVVTAFGKDAQKRKCITMDICVRAEQLRAYLENNGIIRKFGL